ARSDPARPGLLVPAALPLCHRDLRREAAAAGPGRRAGTALGLLPQQRARRGGPGGMTLATEGSAPLLQVRGLKMHFPVTEGMIARRHIGDVKAVDGVDVTIGRGETLGLVGQSGCGKTTMGRCILRLEKPTAGEIIYDGFDIA